MNQKEILTAPKVNVISSLDVVNKPFTGGALIFNAMKEIKLTQGKVALVDDEDFEYLNQFKWCIDGCGYPQRSIKTEKGWRPIRMHRLMLGLKDGEYGDHINKDRLDHRRCNLRKCTLQQNRMNMGRIGSSKLKYIGIDIAPSGLFYARISVKGVKKHLGSFTTIEDAARSRDNAAKKYYGEFANLNFKS